MVWYWAEFTISLTALPSQEPQLETLVGTTLKSGKLLTLTILLSVAVHPFNEYPKVT
jgi:hypothetical protein